MTFEVVIEKLVAGGDGLGFMDGKAVFVPGALPGERVRVESVESRADFSRAMLRQVLSASPHRREPPCPLAGTCGGCDWQHIEYAEQLAQKKSIVAEALRRTGGIRLEEAGVGPLAIEHGIPLGYRARLQVHRGAGGALGFMAAASNTVVPVQSCPVATRDANRVFLSAPPEGADRFTVFGHGGAFAFEGSPDGEEIRLEILGVPIAFSVRCFFQSNVEALEKLILFVKGALGGPAAGPAADLYCGVGVFGAFLASAFAGITAVESDRTAIAYAKRNVARGRNKFFATDVETWTAERQARAPFSAAVVDPPRTGLSRKVREYLADRKPPALVYVSCNPVTLARDLAFLVSSGFALKDMRLFDFFPQTSHVETVAVLRAP